jgi:hypothetical protein
MSKAGLFLVGTIVLLLVVLHVQLIIHAPIEDFDTVEAIRAITTHDRISNGIEGDMAHPCVMWVNWKALASIPMPQKKALWHIECVIFLLLTIIALAYSAKSLGVPLAGAMAAVLFFLASPAIHDISARAEENLNYHLLYILCILAFIRMEKKPSAGMLVQVAIANFAMSLWHMQPFMILIGSQAIFIGITMRRSGVRLFALKLIASVVIPILLFGIYKIIFRVHYVPYQTMYFTLFAQPNMAYVASFLSAIHGYMFGGGITVNAANVAQGIVCVTLLLSFLIVNRNRNGYLTYLAITALVFAFVYEPISSERWDTLVICLALMLGLRLKDVSMMDAVIATSLLIMLPSTIANDYSMLAYKSKTEAIAVSLLDQQGIARIPVMARDDARKLIYQIPLFTPLYADDHR